MKSKQNVSIPISIPYLLMFLLLTFLCMEAHETFHHLVGGVLCGGLGTMTLTIYTPKPKCDLDMITLAGPFLSFAIAWFGAYWLTKRKHMLFACTLIFASFAHLRFPLPLMGSGDEWFVVRRNFQQPNPYFVAVILFLLALPPLIFAFRSIANRQRLPIFIVLWLLPLSLLYGLPFVDEWLFGPDLINAGGSLLGIPVVVLIADIFAGFFLVLSGNPIFRQENPI